MKNKSRIQLFHLIGIIVLVSQLIFSVDYAQAQQEDELVMNLRRDFGYSSGTGEIQGTFSWSCKGTENLVKVEFYLDERLIGEDTESPYKIQFNTDSYPPGPHIFKAIGYTSDGRVITSKEQKATFVSAEEGWKSVGKIILPIGGIALGVILISAIFPVLLSGRKNAYLPLGTPRNYGFSGGAVCPKCQRPFVLHLLTPNLVTHKLDRCPYCGKWSAVKPLSLEKLRLAEQAELELAGKQEGIAEESQADKLHKELDDSRYQGL